MYRRNTERNHPLCDVHPESGHHRGNEDNTSYYGNILPVYAWDDLLPIHTWNDPIAWSIVLRTYATKALGYSSHPQRLPPLLLPELPFPSRPNQRQHHRILDQANLLQHSQPRCTFLIGYSLGLLCLYRLSMTNDDSMVEVEQLMQMLRMAPYEPAWIY
ncbi:uncharacterized protein LACBIDRAFT_304160 [Laccaria bicolor S238N-H82]|uniref:Predicted protein n=1 Tax=Laccaria bicolor (strain S238N-H82 / ATCC MYA-4686) TaxID=486041 RepID=B0DL32_LACBS|nr:uncharacterized protein LACBIDRAFT_304160 [Laccaria bicolor S238N-H82]EDR04840.1 predicted protein [Laccaria bicolor S238N-H82]|eukprot:XP_001884664.1 predicted protein [Laccaria bicolor S238N-H82]